MAFAMIFILWQYHTRKHGRYSGNLFSSETDIDAGFPAVAVGPHRLIILSRSLAEALTIHQTWELSASIVTQAVIHIWNVGWNPASIVRNKDFPTWKVYRDIGA